MTTTHQPPALNIQATLAALQLQTQRVLAATTADDLANEVKRAKAISEMAGKVTDVARVLVDYAHKSGHGNNVTFLDGDSNAHQAITHPGPGRTQHRLLG